MQKKSNIISFFCCITTALINSSFADLPQLDEGSVVQSNQINVSNQGALTQQSAENTNLVTVGDVTESPASESQPQRNTVAHQPSYENVDYAVTSAPEVPEQPIDPKEKLQEAAPEESSETPQISPAMLAAGAAALGIASVGGVGAYMVKEGIDAENKAAEYRRRSQEVDQEAAQKVQEKAAVENQLKNASTPQERVSLQQKLSEATARVQEVESRRQTAAVLAAKYDAKRPTGMTGSVVRGITETKATLQQKVKPITDAYKASKEQAKTDWRYRRGR